MASGRDNNARSQLEVALFVKATIRIIPIITIEYARRRYMTVSKSLLVGQSREDDRGNVAMSLPRDYVGHIVHERPQHRVLGYSVHYSSNNNTTNG